ncbi:MAG: hypothetical protein V3R14_01465 [Nitrospinaceae bacterium]
MNMIPCPHCGQEISPASTVCNKCQTEFNQVARYYISESDLQKKSALLKLQKTWTYFTAIACFGAGIYFSSVILFDLFALFMVWYLITRIRIERLKKYHP